MEIVVIMFAQGSLIWLFENTSFGTLWNYVQIC